MAGGCCCLLFWFCCQHINTKAMWMPCPSREREQPVVLRKAKTQPWCPNVKELRLSTSHQTHAREWQGWRRGQHLLRKVLFFTALRFKFMAKYFLLPCAQKMSTSFLVTGLSMPISCSPAKDLLHHSGPRSSFWLALSTTLCSHWAQHGVMSSFPHCYSVISVISELIRDHSCLAEHAHNVSELMLDPLSYFHPIWSWTISLTLWITPKPQTVRTTSITAAMGPVPPAASVAFQRLTRTN